VQSCIRRNKYTPTPQLISSSTSLCKCSQGFHQALDHQNQPQAAPSSQVTLLNILELPSFRFRYFEIVFLTMFLSFTSSVRDCLEYFWRRKLMFWPVLDPISGLHGWREVWWEALLTSTGFGQNQCIFLSRWTPSEDRLQTNRGYKKPNRNTDFGPMIFVSYSRIGIFKICIPIHIKEYRFLKRIFLS
jgi:hypothetical protein